MSRMCALLVLSLCTFLPACDNYTGAIGVVYDDGGRMFSCVMVGEGESAQLPPGRRRIVYVKSGNWDDAFKRLGITYEECAALSHPPTLPAKDASAEP